MRERGEARRQRLWKWGPESRLLCASPVRRSVPAKVVTTILRGSYFGEPLLVWKRGGGVTYKVYGTYCRNFGGRLGGENSQPVNFMVA